MKRIMLMLWLVLSGCEQVLDIDVPLKNPSLVLNLVFDPQNEWNGYVGRNKQILDTATMRVENALVVIYADGQPVDTLTHIKNGYYGSDNKPSPGVEYEVKVSAPDLADVSATSSIPVAAQITSMLVGPEVNQTGRSYNDLKVVFKDDPATENFYEITLERVEDRIDSNGNVVEEVRPIVMTIDEPLSTTGQSEIEKQCDSKTYLSSVAGCAGNGGYCNWFSFCNGEGPSWDDQRNYYGEYCYRY